MDGEVSSWVPVTSGIPQGSVIGPILFLVYINDLPAKLQSKVQLFADDTVAYPVQRTRDAVHWRSGSVNHSIEFNSTS